MRILHVLNEWRPYGAETMLRAAAASWRQQGITGEVLSTGAEPVEYADVLRQAGYRVHHLPFAKSAAFLAGFFHLVRRGADAARRAEGERCLLALCRTSFVCW